MLDVCDPRVIRALLEKYGFHFSKAKGQNFLTQRWVPQRIAQEAGIDRSTGVLEIGPGFGPLTQELCLRAGRVTAIELDTTLRPVLAETVGEFNNLTIHFADAMKMDLPALVQAEFPGLTPAACANLPYYITSPVLTRLLESRCFSAVTVMVQKEVARRICAAPGTADYSAFSILCQYHAAPELLFDVPASCFIPQRRRLPAHAARARGHPRRGAVLPHGARQLCPAPQDARQRAGLRLSAADEGGADRRAGRMRSACQCPRRNARPRGLRRPVQCHRRKAVGFQSCVVGERYAPPGAMLSIRTGFRQKRTNQLRL